MRYWKRVDAQGKTTTVESCSHNLAVAGAVGIDKAEYDAYIASLPPPTPIQDSPDVLTVKAFLADPHSGLPDLGTAVQALARIVLERG